MKKILEKTLTGKFSKKKKTLFRTVSVFAAVLSVFPAMNAMAEQEQELELDSGMSTYTGYTLYDEVIGQYLTGMESGWDAGQFTENDLCYLASYLSEAGELGYYTKDLDMDGTDELLIGQVDSENYTSMFYELYTIRDSALVKVVSSSERDRYYLAEDNIILNEGSSGAAHSFFCHYEFLDQTLVFLDAVIYDGDYDAENPWFYTDTDSTLEDRSEPISQQQASSIEELYPAVAIYFTPIAGGTLSDLQVQARAEVSQIAEQSSLLKDKIRNSLVQSDMNQYAAELYQLWDDELNQLWSYLKQALPEDEMSALTDEEIAWISEKESAVQQAGALYEDGTMQSFAQSQEAASWTEERVYVLLNRIP